MDHVLPRNETHGQQVAPVQICAIDGDRVDLFGRVDTLNLARGCVPVASGLNLNHVTYSPAPLALNPRELVFDVEKQVVSAVLSDGGQDRNIQLDGGSDDLGFRDGSLVVTVK